ncbi:hypothetical protein VMCG_08330 [Cytospora schulzeri]|uniref:4Fe-4S ferredoxin-type domain-containing protein n=1 Tax=Cytospora schulzeri TaxID=448051 RepID=A0A423VVA3_9PEZI|nr:hypothetical protein VMCG_08330 [Valsa malicola]
MSVWLEGLGKGEGGYAGRSRAVTIDISYSDMKLATITPALAPVAFAVITTNHRVNTTAFFPLALQLPLTFTLAPNATNTLKSHNLWLPDPKTFAATSEPDTFIDLNTVDCAAEARKFAASGLDVNDLVRVTIRNDNNAAGSGWDLSEGGHVDSTKDCTRCGTCQKVCFGLFWFLPLYGM